MSPAVFYRDVVRLIGRSDEFLLHDQEHAKAIASSSRGSCDARANRHDERVSKTSVHDEYRIRLRALALATADVRRLQGEGLSDDLSIAVGSALAAVYDLHEAYFAHQGIETLREKDAHLTVEGGEIIGALACARGARSHDLIAITDTSGLGELPFGQGPFGGGPMWAKHSWVDKRLATRAGWYEDLVSWQSLFKPLELAVEWFRARVP